MGGSKHWSEALKTLTGETEISADAILEYFKPLHDFLKVENDRLASEDQVRQIFEKYNKEAIIFANKVTIADWDKTTDLNNETKEEQYVEIVGENAKFTKDQYNLHFRNLSADNFTDEKIRRQLKKVTNLGTSILDESRLRQFTETVNEMVKIYNNATFCSYFKPNCTNKERLTLDPGKNAYTNIQAISFDVFDFVSLMLKMTTSRIMIYSFNTQRSLKLWQIPQIIWNWSTHGLCGTTAPVH